MASPLAAGLFHRAIAQSGAFMAPTAASTDHADRMQDLTAAEDRPCPRSCARLQVSRTAPGLLPDQVVAVPAGSFLGEAPESPSGWTRGGGLPVERGEFNGGYPIVDGHASSRAHLVTSSRAALRSASRS